jgi:TRAP-type mannitol/chloroaromatic compound transport system permease large subunit
MAPISCMNMYKSNIIIKFIHVHLYFMFIVIGKCHTDKHLIPLPEVQEHFRERIERRRNKVKK